MKVLTNNPNDPCYSPDTCDYARNKLIEYIENNCKNKDLKNTLILEVDNLIYGILSTTLISIEQYGNFAKNIKERIKKSNDSLHTKIIEAYTEGLKDPYRIYNYNGLIDEMEILKNGRF